MTVAKWKYEMVTVKPSLSPSKYREALKRTLDDMGQKGWELVTAPPMISALAEMVLFFKRPA